MTLACKVRCDGNVLADREKAEEDTPNEERPNEVKHNEEKPNKVRWSDEVNKETPSGEGLKEKTPGEDKPFYDESDADSLCVALWPGVDFSQCGSSDGER